MTAAPILVFDLDGTLADTAQDLVGALNVLLERDGFAPVTLTAARRMVGAGARELIQRGYASHGAPLEPERLDALFGDFIAHYRDHIADETQLFPGAASSIEHFANAGFRLAVCTNKPEALSKLLLERLGVAERFAAICGRETFPVAKPDPKTLALTVEKAQGDLGQAVMIGDSRTDIDAAKGAGVPVIAVDFGYTETPLEAFSPDRIISHFDELWDAVASLRPSRRYARS